MTPPAPAVTLTTTPTGPSLRVVWPDGSTWTLPVEPAELLRLAREIAKELGEK